MAIIKVDYGEVSGGGINYEMDNIPTTETEIFNKKTNNAIGICSDSSIHTGQEQKLYFAVKDGVLVKDYITNSGYGSIVYTDGTLVVKAKNIADASYCIMYE